MVADLRRLVGRLEATVGELQESLSARDARIAELEKLVDESRRSGKRQAAPFSKGAPKLEPQRPGRKRGDAHGRHGHRQPPAELDVELDAPLPGGCPHCGGADIEHERDAEQFVTDLPVLPAPVRTRFRVGVGRCRSCGRRVQGRHPDQISDALGAAGAQVGPTVKAWSAWLHYTLGLSFEKITKLFADRFGLGVTAGALCQAAQSTSTDLVPALSDCRQRVNDASMVVMDETGWRINGHSAWLWVATSRDVTVYNVAEGRGFDQACDLLDADYSGVIVRDGWAPYRCYEAATHQTCTAHLLRRCHELIEDLPAWARSTPRQVKDLLLDGLAARDLDDDDRAAAVVDLTERIDLLGEQAHPHDECRKLVKHLLNERDALFSYLADPTIDATNWRGEQAIRPAVVNRKVSGGNRSPRGAVTQGRMMTLFRTATQQGIDALDYLVHLARAPDPATIPLFT